jgi:hypothetical protein
MSRKKLGSKRKRGTKVVPVLGAAGLSLSLAGGASAASAQVADALTHKAVVSHEITLGEEENRGRQLGDILYLRQENAGLIAAKRKAGVWPLDGHLLHVRK